MNETNFFKKRANPNKINITIENIGRYAYSRLNRKTHISTQSHGLVNAFLPNFYHAKIFTPTAAPLTVPTFAPQILGRRAADPQTRNPSPQCRDLDS